MLPKDIRHGHLRRSPRCHRRVGLLCARLARARRVQASMASQDRLVSAALLEAFVAADEDFIGSKGQAGSTATTCIALGNRGWALVGTRRRRKTQPASLCNACLQCFLVFLAPCAFQRARRSSLLFIAISLAGTFCRNVAGWLAGTFCRHFAGTFCRFRWVARTRAVLRMTRRFPFRQRPDFAVSLCPQLRRQRGRQPHGTLPARGRSAGTVRGPQAQPRGRGRAHQGRGGLHNQQAGGRARGLGRGFGGWG